MGHTDIDIIKASGEKAHFNMEKVETSLRRAGVSQEDIDYITNRLARELYDGISTKEIYNRAYGYLKKINNSSASRYKLKKAIYELGPTGFPFEKFIAAILQNTGYQVEVGKILPGKCVNHEIDVIARKDGRNTLIECKFHSDQGRNCDVKIPLYIHSRYKDILDQNRTSKNKDANKFEECWVVTNTRFTADAHTYGKCANLFLLSWDYPKSSSLKKRIDSSGLYPITVSTLLTGREKQFLLSRDVVLCRELINDKFYLDHLGVSEKRQKKILHEMENLCNTS
ncbi:restriction endonuclease [Salegentibacter chungangensis]|uniref:Restriction endonuclease n=1 Tax=Salegentibacter chungangensis TaxID=1335724 RepID=A0ABW3NW06_9FLAO